MSAERVTPFSSGSEYAEWVHNNCDRCVRSDEYVPEEPGDPPAGRSCDLEFALSRAYCTDGTLSAEEAARLGVPVDRRWPWWCRERWTPGDPAPIHPVPPEQLPLPALLAATRFRR